MKTMRSEAKQIEILLHHLRGPKHTSVINHFHREFSIQVIAKALKIYRLSNVGKTLFVNPVMRKRAMFKEYVNEHPCEVTDDYEYDTTGFDVVFAIDRDIRYYSSDNKYNDWDYRRCLYLRFENSPKWDHTEMQRVPELRKVIVLTGI